MVLLVSHLNETCVQPLEKEKKSELLSLQGLKDVWYFVFIFLTSFTFKLSTFMWKSWRDNEHGTSQ